MQHTACSFLSQPLPWMVCVCVCDHAVCAQGLQGVEWDWVGRQAVRATERRQKCLPCYPGGCWHALLLSQQQWGRLSTITHQLCPEYSWAKDLYLSWCNSGAVVACSCLFPVQGAKYQLGTTQCCQLIIAFFCFCF